MLKKLLLRLAVALTQSRALTGYMVRIRAHWWVSSQDEWSCQIWWETCYAVFNIPTVLPLHTPCPFTPTQRCFHPFSHQDFWDPGWGWNNSPLITEQALANHEDVRYGMSCIANSKPQAMNSFVRSAWETLLCVLILSESTLDRIKIHLTWERWKNISA